MGIQGGRPSWQGQGAAPIVGAWGQRHHKTKVQEKLKIGKAPMRSSNEN